VPQYQRFIISAKKKPATMRPSKIIDDLSDTRIKILFFALPGSDIRLQRRLGGVYEIFPLSFNMS